MVELIGYSVYLTTIKLGKLGGQKMKAVGVLALVCFVVALIASVTLGIANYQINREISGWKLRAQVSSEPNDMHTYMSRVKSGMETWGMTTGYAALVFQTPENDMELIYRAVNQHVDQAEILTKMDRSSPEYQTGLDNLRGSIRELDLHAFGYWAVHRGLIWNLLCWIGWLLFIILGCWWLIWISI